ncbi:MAG: hypothetical protein ACYCOU_23435, partial [Sulfobacillus sp.]
MKITIDLLEAKGACDSGLRYFTKTWGGGASVDYQEVLDRLAEDDRPDDAGWLLNELGPDKTAEKIVTEPVTAKHLFAAGRLVIRVA